MSLARCWGTQLHGVTASLVEVEAHIGNGLPGMTIVGLPDASVNEARERVRAAVANSGARWPDRRLTVALLPATQRKRGSGLDMAIAAAVLTASGQMPDSELDEVVLIGELGLDGRTRSVAGALCRVIAAEQAGRRVLVCPADLAEAALVDPQAAAVDSLGHLLRVVHHRDEPFSHLSPHVPRQQGSEVPGAAPIPAMGARPHRGDPPDVRDLDMADVRGQVRAKHALEVAAAGGHHLLLLGAPGTGKTMLAERLPSLLPRLTSQEALEVASVHSACGLQRSQGALPRRRPFVAPHHTTTAVAMVGGGHAGGLKPGLITRAHRGVLFLDEAPEFGRTCLEALREPLERGEITLARLADSVVLPARVQLVLAANPCPCGRFEGDGGQCQCPVAARRRYRQRLSGPLLDRVDLACGMDPPGHHSAGAQAPSETSRVLAERIAAARVRMADRFEGLGYSTNADIPVAHLEGRFSPSAAARDVLVELERSGNVSMRGLHRVSRVAWTLADLDGAEQPELVHVSSALSLRVPGAWSRWQ